QPIERRAVAQLEAEDGVDPQVRALRVCRASVAARDGEADADVRRRHFFVVGEAPQRFEASRVRVRPVEDADLRGRAEANAVGKEIAEVERAAQDQLRGLSEVDPAAHAESEQTDARAGMLRSLGRLELL